MGLELATPARASVTVLQVIEPEDPLPTYDDRPPPGVDRVQFLAERRFANIVPVLERTELQWARRVEVGQVPKRICEVASEEGSDVIVIGSRGLSGIGRLLLGSVSEYVARHAPCSVLIARRPER
jgi:nucleotide-binding universal stress UspA family protein